MEYSKCWLDYQPIEQKEQAWLTLSVMCEGTIVNSAVKEYGNSKCAEILKEYEMAMEAMTACLPEKTNQDVTQGVQLVLNENMTVGKDGYIIEKNAEKLGKGLVGIKNCPIFASCFS